VHARHEGRALLDRAAALQRGPGQGASGGGGGGGGIDKERGERGNTIGEKERARERMETRD